jgi:hypothetical protein
MIYDVGQYNLQFEIPTDNFVFHELYVFHTYKPQDLIDTLEAKASNDDSLIIIFGGFSNIEDVDHWVAPLNDWYRQSPNPLAVFSGRLTPNPELKTAVDFSYNRFKIFDRVSNLFFESNTVLHTDKKHKFYWASTKDWYARRFLLYSLITNNLLRGNLVNYKCIDSHIPGMYLNERYSHSDILKIQNACTSIEGQIPLRAIDSTVEFPQTPLHFFQDSYLGIITDTFFETSAVFFSEKVFNAINFYQLFAYLGAPHSLAYLHSLGYETFGDIIDESYDSLEDHGQRLFAYTQSVTDFLKQPIETIRLAYEKSVDKLHHNKVLLNSQRPDREFTQILAQALNK